MESTVTLTMRDQRTHDVLSALAQGRCTAQQAAQLLGLGVRQTRRKLAAYRAGGLASVVHGNRGRAPANALDPELRRRVEELARGDYVAYNHHHLRDILEEHHDVHISVSSVRRIRLAAGLSSPRKRRRARGRCLRERLPQAGMMLQLDATPFAWLGPDHPPFALVAAIDDATGEAFALFRAQEDTVGYLLLLGDVIGRRGVPHSVYSDRHTIFRAPSQDTLSVDDQLAGKHPESQFGRAMSQLGIRTITAHSAQAKGRVERLHNTLQDRLANELRTARISTLDEANAFLKGFLPRFNKRFAHAPEDPQSAYRPAPPAAELNFALALHFVRTVGKDNAVSFGNRRLPVTRSRAESHAGKRVTVCVALDGKLSFWQGGHCLGKGPTARGQLRVEPARIADLFDQPLTPASDQDQDNRPSPARTKPAQPPASGVTPKPDHPWRKFRYAKDPAPVLQSPRRPEG